MVGFFVVIFYLVIMFYEYLGCGKDGMVVYRFDKFFLMFLGKIDILAYYVFLKKW